MASAADYARWITENQDKVSTPEFLTVANAYREAKLSEGLAASTGIEMSPNPAEGMSGTQKFLAGAGKGMTDLARGAGQLMGLTDEAAIDESNRRDAPLMETGAGVAGNVVGTMAALAPTALIPGVNTYAGATALGAATGAMQPAGSEDSRLANTAIGGAAGFTGQALANGLSRVLNPQTSKAVTDLMDEGVTPTPGQILGGTSARMESAAESIPFVGTGIRDSKVRANTEYNLAALNRVINTLKRPLNLIDDAIEGDFFPAPASVSAGNAAEGATYQADDIARRLLGADTNRLSAGLPNAPAPPPRGIGNAMPEMGAPEQILLGGAPPRAAEGVLSATDEVMRDVPERAYARITQAGHEGVQQAREAVQQAYEDALSPIKQVFIDQKFTGEIARIREMGQTLTAPRRTQLNRILQQELLGRFTPSGTMSGESFKVAESQLKKNAATFLKNSDFDQQQIGDALNAAAASLRRLGTREYPQAIPAVRRADFAYAQLLRVERAASQLGAQEGVFTPSQLASAVRGMDDSLRKLNSAQGGALMQDLAESGKSVLGNNLPNSGSADRLLNALVLGGGYAIDPSIAAGALGGRAAYTGPSQRALAALLAKRPPASRAAGQYVRRLAPAAAVGSAELAQALRD